MGKILLAAAIAGSILLPEHVRLLACAMETEADERLGDYQIEAGRWVAHVALNRAETGWWGTLEETLQRDFHGIDRCVLPQQWSVDLAREVLRRQTDPTDSSLFVLSYSDLAKLGPGDPPVHCIGTDRAGLCFYRSWAW